MPRSKGKAEKLRAIEVTAGVWWVEIPAAQLRILCGCPADTVKHLMKRGLVAPRELNGVSFESGPNVILLSDALVQNGDISNLAEFPILQMLYRQGMILPDHPGNDGTRPLLLGCAEQVEAQLQYIHRGNYGLINEVEIIESGASPDLARELMRIKLKFAFGNICHPTELIDSKVIAAEAVEIRQGVWIKRLRFNVFEITTGHQSITVDLNLPRFKSYESPYPLGFHRFRRDYFAVVHSGEGDGWDINRPSMASILIFQGRLFLIDAGPNIFYVLNSLGIGLNEIEGVFNTHGHDDHFAGLPMLIRSDHRIKYFATPQVRASVAKKLAALLSIDESAFFDYFDVVDLTMGEWNNIEGLEVRPSLSPHPVETTILHFRALWEGGYRTYAHLADICRLTVLRDFITADPAAPGISQQRYDQVVADYGEPADVKKIDIGGGLIHGDAYDFRSDQSGKIILAHTAERNTRAQKAIGSSASFGMVDVLIPSNHDLIWRQAYEALSSYFPDIPHYEIRVLLNSPLLTVNPGTILIRERVPNQHIYLLLSGTIEMIPVDVGVSSLLSAGALIGELSGLFGCSATETYRAASSVVVLEIPRLLYLALIKRNNIYFGVERILEHREFLLRTRLFGDVVSSITLNRVAQVMTLIRCPAGASIAPAENAVAMVRTGSVGRFLRGELLETLGVGAFFGEEAVIRSNTPPLEVRALEPSTLFLVPANAIKDIPSVRWKIFEAMSKVSGGGWDAHPGHGEAGTH